MSHWSDYLYDHLPEVLSCRVENKIGSSSSSSSVVLPDQTEDKQTSMETSVDSIKKTSHPSTQEQVVQQIWTWYESHENKQAVRLTAAQQVQGIRSLLEHVSASPEKSKLMIALCRCLFTNEST
jgi:hypothetical protein